VRVLRLACALLLAAAGPIGASAPAAPLRVCSDPNNLPFSNNRGEGFENRLAEMLAADLHTTVAYTWWPQRRGFIRNTLGAGLCDVVMGVPSGYPLAQPTGAYYRSTYVFVSQRRRHLDVTSFDDPRLRTWRVGVQLVGDDVAGSPPAHALSARGLTRNVVGFSVLGDYSQPNPPARIVEAVARGDVDVALVWGPLAGYFARRSAVALTLAPTPAFDRGLPFAFDISMAVRRGDTARLAQLDRFITREKRRIDALLAEYGVPPASADPRGQS
jgi:quinoprotein dehydrogenase-associated probable ABC transporter substrate-binding protein